MSDFWIFTEAGFRHVFDFKAYDHILFISLLAAPYVFKNWKQVLFLITAFTVGHTLSLFLSAYDLITVNTAMVEFMIPVTILVAALYNVFTAGKTSRNSGNILFLIITLFFGLIHGLGFAGYFERLTRDIDAKALPLLEFSLGIECAQVAIVILILILNFIMENLFRFSRKEWVQILSSIVIGMVIPMLVARWIW